MARRGSQEDPWKPYIPGREKVNLIHVSPNLYELYECQPHLIADIGTVQKGLNTITHLTKMSRHPPSTIYRYLDLPSTQTTLIHKTPKCNTTPPSQTLVQATNLLPPPNTTHTTHTTTIQRPTHMP